MTATYSSIEAQPHTPPYKIHRYFARRPWNVFEQIIKTYSKNNDIILDPFCGGGVTIYEGIKLGRKVAGFDLNPLSIFIVKNMIKKNTNLLEMDLAYSRIESYLKSLYGNFNIVKIKSDQKNLIDEQASIDWNEIAFNVFCNICGAKVSLSNDNKLSNGRYSCINLKCSGHKKNNGFVEPSKCRRDGYEYLYSVANILGNKRKIIIKFDVSRIENIKKHVRFLRQELKKNKIIIEKNKIPLNWDRQNEDLLDKKGIKSFQDLFTTRNFLINLLLRNYISELKVSKNTYEILRLAFSSSLRDTNIMSFTNECWQSGKPTTWSKHAYWIPSQFCEVSVTTAFKNAYNRIKSAIIFNEQFDYEVVFADKFSDLFKKSNIYLANSSIDESNIPSGSVDVIITDPPYGSNVQYLELSHFWYVWNKDMYDKQQPDFSKEAVANRKKNFIGSKSMKDYEDNLFKVFNKAYDALKPGGRMVLTFNNKDMGAWLALLISIFRSGFVLEKNGLYFQDGIDNYKQTAHTKYKGSPYGDFIYVFRKINIRTQKCRHEINEKKLIEKVSSIFHEYMHNFRKEKSNRNEIIKKMFLEIIPMVECFVRTNSSRKNNHNLYAYFHKNYLKEIYD